MPLTLDLFGLWRGLEASFALAELAELLAAGREAALALALEPAPVFVVGIRELGGERALVPRTIGLLRGLLAVRGALAAARGL